MNFFLVTERCDNFCVMCSQPPKDRDDDWLRRELLEAIPLISPDALELGITGGEPALLRDGLVELIASLAHHLPKTALHILSNGRAFSRPELASAIAAAAHPDVMLGIPVYSDLPEEHDYVVQARGAFDETLRGILNLKKAGVRVEIRFVIHRETYQRMREFAEFVARNLRFVDHIALMGLELTGFAKTNVDRLWIDPVDYAEELRDATHTLQRAGMRVSIYNHQLCTLPADIHPFARKSISDWKNTFDLECEDCVSKAACGGFFSTGAKKRSSGIKRFTFDILTAIANK